MHGCWLTSTIFSLLLATSVRAAQEGEPAASNLSAVTVVHDGEPPHRKLEYKFANGQFAHYEVTSKMTMTTQHGQAQVKAVNESQAWKMFRVVTVDANGHATLEPLIERVKMQAQIDNLPPTTYDSQLDPAPPREFAEVAKSIGRAHARFLYSRDGELLKIITLPGAPPYLTAAAEKVDAKYSFLVPLPKTPVGVGAVWKDRFQVMVTVGEGLGQPVTLQRQFTWKSQDGSVATILSKTSVLSPINNPQVEGQLMQRTPSAVIKFDLERGLVLSQTASVDQEVVNALGPNTRLHAQSETVERLIPTPAGVQPAALKQ